MKNKTKKLLIKAVVAGIMATIGVIATTLGLTSCNVTRVITNESRYLQKGDTSLTIQTKTIESYNAKKNN